MYELNELFATFIDHSQKAEQFNKKLITDFLENNPDSELPDHFKDDFSLPMALASICHEILMIKNHMSNETNP